MPDNNDKLNKKVDKLEKKIEDLEKKLADNTRADKERDERHHQELKALQEKNHKENLTINKESATWNRTGAVLTPLAIAVIPFIVKYFDRKQTITPQTIQPIKKDADTMNEKLTQILEAIKDKDKQ